MYPFEKLDVWKLSHALAIQILNDLGSGNDQRTAMVADQACRAACSIGANIAEGAGSASHAQFARFLSIALSSAFELENHLRVAGDARLMNRKAADERIVTVIRVKKMLWSLRAKVKSDPRGKKPNSVERGEDARPTSRE
jgi:four helix bundle protein